MPATKPWVRLSIMAATAGGMFTLAALLLPHSAAGIRAAVAGYGWIAPLAFVALWVVLTPAMFSGAILAGSAGLAFGPVLGTVLGVAGATGGALLSFAIARRWGSNSWMQVAPARVKLIEDHLSARPFRSVLMLRLLPAVPATWLNYGAGLMRISARPFAAASALGAAPRILIYAGLAGSVAGSDHTLLIASVALYAVLGAAGLAVAAREHRLLRAARG
jgi:uncharacterized membrane protein YdjX (TVP38/TMEM64 family)